MTKTSMIALSLALLGCATGGGSGLDSGVRRDSGQLDAAEVVDARTPRDGGRDAGPVDASGTTDSGRDSGTGNDAGSGCPPTSDRVAIVEVMVASLSGSTDRGEWIEVMNVGDCAVDLAGTELVSGTATFTMPSLVIPPGGRRVLAQSGDTAENHGLVVDVVYGSGTTGIVLDNGGDTLELRMGSTTVDRVAWIATDHVASSSRMFPDGASVTTNDSQARWCNSTSVYATVGTTMIRGTPGMGNGACP